MKTLEKYLMEVHANQYHGTDDDMIDDYERWLGELDVAEVMDYAEQIIYKLQNDKKD